MSYNYQDMLSSFKDWVNNSSLFVKRQVGRIPELTWDSKDDMFSNLTQPDPEMDDNTTQNLEIILLLSQKECWKAIFKMENMATQLLSLFSSQV